MLTPTRREVVETAPRKIVVGAHMWGGRYDGARVVQTKRIQGPPPIVVAVLHDGTELVIDDDSPILWLHPASKQQAVPATQWHPPGPVS